MRKIKLAIVLPVFQLLLAAGLLEAAYVGRPAFPPHGDELYVPTLRLICLGINAPAWVLTILLSGLPLRNVELFGLYTSDFEFLAFVAVVWFFVGKALDARATPRRPKPPRTPGRIVSRASLVVLGLVLFVMALSSLRSPARYNNVSGNILEGILSLSWSLLLIVFSGRQLWRSPSVAGSPPESVR
jgi:hypothetical protein